MRGHTARDLGRGLAPPFHPPEIALVEGQGSRPRAVMTPSRRSRRVSRQASMAPGSIGLWPGSSGLRTKPRRSSAIWPARARSWPSRVRSTGGWRTERGSLPSSKRSRANEAAVSPARSGVTHTGRHHRWFPRSGEIIGRCRQNQLWPRLISKLAGRVMRLQLGQSGGSSLPNLAHMGHKRSQSLPRHSPTKMRPISECAISERRLHSSFPYSLFSTRTVWLGS